MVISPAIINIKITNENNTNRARARAQRLSELNNKSFLRENTTICHYN